MKQYRIAVIEGDMRNVYVAQLLEKRGHQVTGYGLSESSSRCAATLKEAMDSANIIIGGIPFRNAEVADLIQNQHTFFAGMLTEEFMKKCTNRGAICYDFMKEETLAQKNAIATAEGAILEALKNQPTNLHKSKCLVLGYGRCGSVLAQKLKGFAAEVTVCSNCREELARGESFGINTLFLKDLEQEIGKYEYIFNTVPAVIVKDDSLQEMDKSAIIIDLASGMGGIDYLAAKKREIRAFHCLGLPGKYAAKTSALYMVDYILFQMESRGI